MDLSRTYGRLERFFQRYVHKYPLRHQLSVQFSHQALIPLAVKASHPENSTPFYATFNQVLESNVDGLEGYVVDHAHHLAVRR